MSADAIGAMFGFVLTVAVLSYVIGDNPAYRVALHIFVGAAAGYAVIIAWYNVIYPQMIGPLLSLGAAGLAHPSSVLSDPLALVPMLLGLLLVALFLLKAGGNRAGGIATAFMVGVGVAVAIGGAVTGTLFPQTRATFLSPLPISQSLEKAVESVIIILGTLATLGYFYYGARLRPDRSVDRPLIVKPVATLGQVFIGIAFGVMYAGALAASLAFFAQSLDSMSKFIQRFIAF